MNNFIQTFKNLDPGAKRKAAIIGGAGAIVLLAFTLVSLGSGEKPSMRQDKKTISSVLTDKDPRKVGLDSLTSIQQEQQRKLDELSRNVNAIAESTGTQQESLDTLKALSAQMQQVQQQLEASEGRAEVLEKKAEALEKKVAKGLPVGGASTPEGQQKTPADIQRDQLKNHRYQKTLNDPNANQTKFFESAPEPVVETKKPGQAAKAEEKMKIRTIEEPAPEVAEDEDEGNTFLPAGSIISGALITGLDAPTGNNARRDPFPILLRIKKEAVLPNRFRADVRECFLIASAFGDLSSERAYARAETISCVREDGGVIESGLDAYAAGEDGKAGVRGRLVSKQGAILARSLMAGFMQGVSDAFSVSQVPTINVRGVGDVAGNSSDTYSPVYQQAMNSEALQGAAVSGASQALERIADFYLEMAENLYPVIEIDAAREIDFIVKKGVELKIQSE